MTAPPPTFPLPLLARLVLVVAGILFYAPAIDTPFIFDDIPAVALNASIRDLSQLGEVLTPPADGPAVGGRPLVNLSLAINYAFGGYDPRGYHITNTVLHVMSALTLFALLRRTFSLPRMPDRLRERADSAAFLAALLWTLHPLNSETVICIAQRTEGLAGLLFLLCFLGFVSAANAAKPARWLAVSWVACLAGMATKEIMVAAPVLLLAYDRVFLAGTWREVGQKRARWHLAYAATWLLLAALLIANGAQRGTAAGFGLGVSSWEYLQTQARAIATYLKLIVWPHPLVLDYGTWTADGFSAVAPDFLFVTALVVLTAVALRRWPRAGFAGLWFFAILAPSSSVVPLVAQTIAEHRMYLPLASVLGLAVALLMQWRLALARVTIIVAPLTLGAAFLTWQRSVLFRDPVALWRDNALHARDNPWAYYHLGDALLQRQQFGEAATALERAVATAPQNIYARTGLGLALTKVGRPAEALPHLQAVVQLRPDYPGAQFRLGEAYLALQNPSAAIPHFAEAVKLTPDYADAEGNWGVALFQLGQFEEAVPHLERAATLLPHSADAQLNLGLAYLRARRYDEARRAFAQALQLDPSLDAARQVLEQLESH